MMILRIYGLRIIVALLVSLLVLTQAVIASGETEIVNDNFNLDQGDWSGYDAAISLDANEMAAGAASLKVTKNASGGYPYLNLELMPDKKYYFSCKVKSVAGVTITPRLMLYNDVGNELLSIDLDSNAGVKTSPSAGGWTSIYTPDGFVFQPEIDFKMMILGFVVLPVDDLRPFWIDDVILSSQAITAPSSANPETRDSGRTPIYAYTGILSISIILGILRTMIKRRRT